MTDPGFFLRALLQQMDTASVEELAAVILLKERNGEKSVCHDANVTMTVTQTLSHISHAAAFYRE